MVRLTEVEALGFTIVKGLQVESAVSGPPSS